MGRLLKQQKKGLRKAVLVCFQIVGGLLDEISVRFIGLSPRKREITVELKSSNLHISIYLLGYDLRILIHTV